MKTIKQIADELGVSKTAVRKKIENLGLSGKVQTNGNRILIDDRQESLIKSAFSKIETETENHKPVSEKTETLQLVSGMVSTLTEQLKEKDRQLAEKDKQLEEKDRQIKAVHELLAENQKLLDQQQHLNALTEQKLRLLEQKESQEEEQNQQPEEKQNFWSRLWHKGN